MVEAVEYIYDKLKAHQAKRTSLIRSNDAAQKLFADLEWDDPEPIRTAISAIVALRDTMQKFLDDVIDVYKYAATHSLAAFAPDVVKNYSVLGAELETRIEELENMLELSRLGKERLEDAAKQ